MTLDDFAKNPNLKNQLEKLSADEVALILNDTTIRRFREGEFGKRKKTAICIRIRDDVLERLTDLFNNTGNFANANLLASQSGGIETILEVFLSFITDKDGKLIENSEVFETYKSVYDNNKPSSRFAGKAGYRRNKKDEE